MATIVKLRGSDKHAILVGVGYGMFQSSRPGIFFGEINPTKESGSSEMAAVSTATGQILWCDTRELEVVSVNGESPSDLLRPYFSS